MRSDAKKHDVPQSHDKVDKLIAKNKSIYSEWLKDRFPNYASASSSSSEKSDREFVVKSDKLKQKL